MLPMDSQQRSALAAERLRSSGVRVTAARRLVIEALSATDGPRTAEELNADVAIPLSSLYRTLTVLTSSGILRRVHDGSGTARYEYAEWLTGHHHHIRCTDCGLTQDIDFSPETEATIRRLYETAGAALGFDVTDHRLDLEGRCPECR